MSVAPNAGIVDFSTFKSPEAGVDGLQGQVPAPLAGQTGYVLTTEGWADVAPDAGVPAGGTTGQVLAKASDADYDTEWVDQTGGSGGTDLAVVRKAVSLRL